MPDTFSAGTPRSGPADPCADLLKTQIPEDLIERWNKLMFPPFGANSTTLEGQAIERFLRSREGKELLTKLTDGFGRMGTTVTIELKFVDQVREGRAGEIQPPDPVPQDAGSFRYTAPVRNEKDRVGGQDRTTFPRPNSTRGFDYTYRDGVSEMASTIYHEILHVYYLNEFRILNPDETQPDDASELNNSWSVGDEGPPVIAPRNDPYMHGRGDGATNADSYDQEFLDALEKFARDLERFEACVKKQAQPSPTPTPTTPRRSSGGGAPR